MPRRVLLAASLIIFAAAAASAQDEAALRSFFEGRRVSLKIDMPATSDGVDLHPDSARSIDYPRYRDRLKEYGAAIHAGESTTVTLIKTKKDLIEVQLGGGGFGTFGDDTSTSVYMPLVEKSSREKELEHAIKEEDDLRRRRQLERDLDELRDRRERENRRIEAARTIAEEQKREAIAEKRLRAGSRFNVRYDGGVPAGLRPNELMAALSEYVDFSTIDASTRADEPIAPALIPRKGMTREEAERELGAPVQASERREGTLVVKTLRFVRGDEEITTEFVEDVLIRFATLSR